jgi:hypothetical protein
MKSQASVALQVARAMFKDIALAYPGHAGIGLSKDEARLAQYVKDRGLGLFTLDLPSLDSILTTGLESGHLSLAGPLTRPVSKVIRVPVLFRGLWLCIFHQDGSLRPDADSNAIFFLRSLFAIGKKLALRCSDSRFQETLEEFHRVERSLPRPTLKWDEDDLSPISRLRDIHLRDYLDVPLPLFDKSERGWDPTIGRLLEQCQRVSDIISKRIGTIEAVTQSECSVAGGHGSGFRHGPGAVAERGGKFDKYKFTNWSAKLESYFPFKDIGSYWGQDSEKPRNHEVPSRLIAVPKTAKSMRLIAAEPSEHQWCQQFLRAKLYLFSTTAFKGYFISFADQSKSQDMARLGSLDRSLSTIDLSSASDRLTCKLVERVFRKNPLLLAHMHACRTRYLKDSNQDNPVFVLLNKFVSQGTAITFPVQSYVFLCLALGCVLSNKRVTWKSIMECKDKVRVFGDDIIVPSEAYASMCAVLHLLDLRVNKGKSFNNGFFRESCGGDFYKGDDVTPVKPTTYIGDGPASIQSVLDTSNNFFKKGLWNVSNFLLSTLGRDIKLPFTGLGCRTTGIPTASICGVSFDHLRSRYNHHIQLQEVRVTLLENRGAILDADGTSGMLDYFNSPAPKAFPNVEDRKRKPFSLISEPIPRTPYGIPGRPVLRKRHGWVDPCLFG